MPKTTKVRVPAEAGEEITVNHGAWAEPRTYKVTDREVTVATDDVPVFLANVEGSSEAAKPAASSPKE